MRTRAPISGIEVGELLVLEQHIGTIPHQHRGRSLRAGRPRRAHGPRRNPLVIPWLQRHQARPDLGTAPLPPLKHRPEQLSAPTGDHQQSHGIVPGAKGMGLAYGERRSNTEA